MQSHAIAGGVGGNGGGVHYCPHAVGTQKKLEAYDLWEAKNPLPGSSRKSLVVLDWDGKTTRQAYREKAIRKLAAHSLFLAKHAERLLKFLDSDHLKDSGKLELAMVDDGFHLFVDEGCQYYQLVNWIDSDEDKKMYQLDDEIILRREKTYQAMDSLSQAANDIHEVLFKIKRTYAIEGFGYGSSDVRRLVGELFSEEPLNPKLVGLLGGYTGDFEHGYPLAEFLKPVIDVIGWRSLNLTLQDKVTQKEMEQSELKITNESSDELTFSNALAPSITLKMGESAVIAWRREGSSPRVTADDLEGKKILRSNLLFIAPGSAKSKIRLDFKVGRQKYTSLREYNLSYYPASGSRTLEVNISSPLY